MAGGGAGSARVAGAGEPASARAGAPSKARGPVVVKEAEQGSESEDENKDESEGEGGGEGEGEGKGKGEGDEGEDEGEGNNHEPRGKYSKRKIVDNSWRYEEPEEDPYLKGVWGRLSLSLSLSPFFFSFFLRYSFIRVP